MRTLYPIKYEFDELIKQRINENEKRFYLSTIRAITSENNLQWAEGVFFTSTVFQAKVESSDRALADIFIDWANNESRILDNTSIRSNIDIVVDIRGVERDKALIPLFNLFGDAIEDTIGKGYEKNRFFIFSDLLLDESDILYDIARPYLEGKALYIIDAYGNFQPEQQSKGFNIEKFSERKRDTGPDYTSLIKKKVVRRVGHYKLSEEDTYCKSYFYDASFCISEIAALAMEFIDKRVNKKQNFEYIFYISKLSPWLGDSLRIVDSKLKSVYTNYKGYFTTEEVPNVSRFYTGGEVLIVADFINTGTSIQIAIETILKQIKNLKKENILLWGILNNKLRGIHERRILVNDNEFIVPCVVNVIVEEKVREECKPCQLGLPYTMRENESLKLTSFDFWTLADGASYIEEQFGRQDSKLLKKIIQMSNWFDDNAAYIMFKYQQNLIYNGIDPSETVFIYPDEVENDSGHFGEGSPSMHLAKNLKDFFNAKEIGIPRSAISKYALSNELDQLATAKDEWIEVLKSKTPSNTFVIVDEFHKEGSTFIGIMKIMEYFKRPVRCYFPVIDFNPRKSTQHKEKYVGVKFLNLYEFNFNS